MPLVDLPASLTCILTIAFKHLSPATGGFRHAQQDLAMAKRFDHDDVLRVNVAQQH